MLMHRARLTALRTVFLSSVLGIGILLAARVAHGQISPGPLSRAHEQLSGPTQCTSCHGLAAGSPRLKCRECHTEIARRLAERRGWHATFLSKEASGQDCVRCHSEHNGEDFNLIRWEPSRDALDHKKTGYPLEGRHAGLTCNQCHKVESIPASARDEIRLKDLNRTFLGLSRDCLSCHTDTHRGQLARDCTRCHTLAGWKPASRFDHAPTKYPLTGAHEKVACQKCHPSVTEPKPYVKYVGLAFGQCSPCHSDPHKGTFTATCQTCHNTASWKQVRRVAGSVQGFDHAKTDYPLLGKHRVVACGECHRAGDFKAPLRFAKCSDCHTPDPHRGQFRQSKDGGECAACHSVEGFKPSTYGVAQHAASEYPLEGLHAKVPCAKCHLPKGAETLFKIRQTQCKDCHADAHRGQFAAAPHNNRCENCHDLQGFRPARFTLARHKETRFPLAGAHAAVPCVECHKTTESGKAAPVKYRFDDRTCTACHANPHRSQFRERMSQMRADGTPAGCEACHSTVDWEQVKAFDHAATRFPLVGAHRTIACAGCHRPANGEKTMRNVVFNSVASTCVGCHADIHGGQFAASNKTTDCANCHNSTRWKPATFDHDKRTTFPLQGAHRNVACVDCHKTTRLVQGKPILLYKPTPRECKSCHGATS